jgi:hypothetical protein
MSIEGTRLAGKVEDLGEALFHLSDDANAAEYERVVAAFRALEEQVCES